MCGRSAGRPRWRSPFLSEIDGAYDGRRRWPTHRPTRKRALRGFDGGREGGRQAGLGCSFSPEKKLVPLSPSSSLLPPLPLPSSRNLAFLFPCSALIAKTQGSPESRRRREGGGDVAAPLKTNFPNGISSSSSSTSSFFPSPSFLSPFFTRP